MELNHLSIKYFFEEPSLPDWDVVISTFHDWIRDSQVEGLLLDVADYKHVHQGPGVLLIGHDCDYSVDLIDGEPGLRYRHKRGLHGDPAARFGLLIDRANTAKALLSKALNRNFSTSRVELVVYDRLEATNTPEGLEALKTTLGAAVQAHLGNVIWQAAYEDPRRPLTARLQLT